MIEFAYRLKSLGTETAFEVLSKAKALESQGKNIIHLEIGEPDFDTPSNIIKAAQYCKENSYDLITFSGFDRNNDLCKLGKI